MTDTSGAAQAYQHAVSEIIDARRAGVPYPAGAPVLTIVRHHRPRSIADLARAELLQLGAAWYEPAGSGGRSSDGGAGFASGLAAVLVDEENDVEAAEVVDGTGALRYRLYGWNFGVGYLFPPEGVEVVAFGAQHDIEHWSTAQRDLFAAMDRALRAGGHGFAQPLHFCWSDDACWAEVADVAPHSAGSEPYLRQALARAAAAAP